MSGNIVTMVNAGSSYDSVCWRLTIPKAIVAAVGFDNVDFLQWFPFDDDTLFLRKVIDDSKVFIDKNIVKLQKVGNKDNAYFTYRVSFPMYLADQYSVDVGEKWSWVVEKGDLRFKRVLVDAQVQEV